MAFSSMAFLFGFLPLCLLCCFLMPARLRTGRNAVLLLFSLFFYAWGGLRLLPVLLTSCLATWAAGLLAAPGRKRRKAALLAALVLELGWRTFICPCLSRRACCRRRKITWKGLRRRWHG